ncbi:HNH endonuclease signature motif containing protein, partial [Listeria monocytogenes]
CTVAENNAHAIETGLFDPRATKRTYKIPTCDWVGIYILNRHCGFSLSRLGRMNGCTHYTIKGVVQRVETMLGKELSYAH